MHEGLTPRKSDHGWVVAMMPEMTSEAGVAEGSFLVFYLQEDQVSAEILPPATEEMKHGVEESVRKFGDAFAEMKRLGD
jgi:hypothetical protein